MGTQPTLAEAMITRAVGLVSESLPEGGAGWLGQIAEGLHMSQERAAVAAEAAVTKKQFLLLHP